MKEPPAVWSPSSVVDLDANIGCQTNIMAANDAFAFEGPVWSTISANKDNMTALQTIDAPLWVSAP
jgi:hypothetical protein